MRVVIAIAIFFINVAGFTDSNEITVGEKAPSFNELDQSGKTHSLDDYKGKWLVLEWYNEDCPYVKKHYGSNNMQNLQKKYTSKNVQWLTVSTSAKGKQGYIEPSKAKKHFEEKLYSTALLLDSDGNMGRAYGAKTTPHIFIINPEGYVIYAGAMDNNDSSDPKTIPSAKNYVSTALDQAMSGKNVTKSFSKPYGCSVKYN